ncbi:hydroxymethylglutaryl-CoA lyase [Bacillus sp. FJAT-42376]|uniref:hydroxymethylglutaryl-CoA lyase n=1 Tax=Bacillus sp. FJAT-42376 TaxID=2014076 RepID=UPI000F4EF00B|nr:hydroxymethylglutaryl-CoA lyase [Bacillus sp. FJAT-42376]AZB43430.1 hydroxymethylglutaryl-CoA lyase [Bacillus sp. FJAT-42376]
MRFPIKADLIEVGPRDGLQNEKNVIPSSQKIQFIKDLSQAGFKEMEITSFVSPKWVPQMEDAAEIVKHGAPSVRNIVLTPNEKGLEKAIENECSAVAFFVGVSSTFNQKNINRTTEESMRSLLPLIEKAKNRGLFIRACISTSFYCPYEGKIEEEPVLDLCRQFADAGVDDLSVADTIGMAHPQEVYSLFSRLKEQFPEILLTAHFHDTRGLGLANILAALQAGIDRFDTSAGGLGGCPFAPGASGNVATEDVLYMLQEMKIETGISLDKVLAAVHKMEPFLDKKISSKQYFLWKEKMAAQA